MAQTVEQFAAVAKSLGMPTVREAGGLTHTWNDLLIDVDCQRKNVDVAFGVGTKVCMWCRDMVSRELHAVRVYAEMDDEEKEGERCEECGEPFDRNAERAEVARDKHGVPWNFPNADESSIEHLLIHASHMKEGEQVA